MNAKNIADHLSMSVPTFENVELLGPGVAYHYTVQANAIEKAGKFLGAPLDKNLDKTQDPNKPNVGACDPGVVFAYENLAEAAEEGDCARLIYQGVQPEVFEIQYSAAVRASHMQEAVLDAPSTIMVSSKEIIHFKRLGLCTDHYNENTF